MDQNIAVIELAKYIAERTWDHRCAITNDQFNEKHTRMGNFLWKNMNEVQKAYFMIQARAAMAFLKKHYVVLDKE